METEAVKELLEKLQAGYTRRDQSHLDAFMDLFIPGDELEIIGTNAVEMGKDEWCLGREAARELVSRDWEHWGDVVYDLDNVHIFVKGDVAWIATTATVTDFIPNEDRYNGFVGYAKAVAEEEGVSAQKKMLDIIGLGNDLMAGIFLGEKCVWPFRFTAVAVKEKGGWLFHQLHFSFATTHAPDVRIQ
jgi:hypothetical protein